ncbi:MAG: hypothetical protein JKY81_03590 [Colwellia sp.]|nr:hypothetical protein [Colwellia sp.]
MSNIKAFLSLMVIGVHAVNPALSQTAISQTVAPNSQTPTAPVLNADIAPKTSIRARVKVLTNISLNTPRAIDLGSIVVPGASKDLTSGVTLKAYARYVEFEGRKIAQIVLAGVEKNGQIETLPSQGFSTQLELVEPNLDPDTEVVIEGDGAAMIAALKRLADNSQTPPKETIIGQDTTNQSQKQEAGSPIRQNDQASSYQSPDPVQVADAPVESVAISSDGCAVRIDTAQMKAIQQTKTITSLGGAITNESACSDSSDGFPLAKSYTVCSDAVDMTARTATAQYVLYYVDAGGARKEVTECATDTEKAFPIVEKPSACTIFLDYAANQAVPQSSLIYLNDNNQEIQVRGCEASETKLSVPMIQTTNGCSIRHDFTARKSYQQGTFTYLLDGVSYQAGGCTDDGTIYPQNQIYMDASGQDVCAPTIDLAGGTVTLQSRLQISVGGMGQYISDCTPDTTGQLAITATTNGCDNPMIWDHDVVATQSYAKERFYYLRNGLPKYVTDCQRSQVVYPHQYQTTGYQNHDDQLFAYPLDTVYITPPSGRYDVQVSQVLSGATQMPYQLTGTTTRANGTVSYVACDKFADTDNLELWLRPDATTYEKSIGPGTPVGPTNACVAQGATTATDWTLVPFSDFIASPGARGGCYNSANLTRFFQYVTGYARYKATRQMVREDGVVISEETRISPTTFLFGNNRVTGAYLGPGCAYTGGAWYFTSTTNMSYLNANVQRVSTNFPPPSVNPPTGTDIGALKSSANFLY